MPLPLVPIVASGLIAGLGVLIRAGVQYALTGLIVSLVTSLGVGVISYAAISPLVDSVISNALSYLDLPVEYKQFAGVLRVDQVITVWTSAMTTRLSFTAMKRFGFKR